MSDKLRLEDLKIGMEVTIDDLKGIYDTYFVVSNLVNLDSVVRLEYISKDLTSEADKFNLSGYTLLYFDKYEMTGEVSYDE